MTNEQMRQRIAELEEGFRRIQAIERAQAPDDDEYGYLTCNADGFNDALQECQGIAASLLSQTETPVEETGGEKMLPCPFCGDPPSEMHTHHKKHLPKIYWCECDGYSTQADEDDADYRTAQEWNDPEWREPAQETGDVERVAKDAAERAAKNSGAPAEMLYAPILFALRDGLAAMRPVSVDREKLAEIRARHDSVADTADDEWDTRIYTIADDAFSDRAFLLSVIEGVNHDD